MSVAYRSGALGVLALLLGAGEVAANDAEVRPVGVWSCLMYGEAGNQRFFLELAADNSVRMARLAEAEDGVWRPLGAWRRQRGRLEFADEANGRLFVARLAFTDLGGTWRGIRDGGGWWCAAETRAADGAPPPVHRLLESLVPAIMASPNYPLGAIREAKEGRTVSCFIVMGTGEIRRPEVIESTDEIFRRPTLEAVAASRYRSWGDESAALPACRSFTFELGTDG